MCRLHRYLLAELKSSLCIAAVGALASGAVGLSACRAGGADARPVERAVIEVPAPPRPAESAPIAVDPRPARPAAKRTSNLESEIADTLNGFTKRSRCDDFDYFPEGGYQNFWCHRPASLTAAALEARAGVSIFVSGPHGHGFDSKAKADFGHYNPAFVRWLADDVAPSGPDSPLVQSTSSMYAAMMRPLATVFYRTSLKVRAERACFERERDAYKRLLTARTLPEGYHEHWFFFMNQEFCPRTARGLRGDAYYYQHGMDGGVEGNVVKSVLGFFVRRSLDGTLPEFERALDKLIAAYQPDLMTRP